MRIVPEESAEEPSNGLVYVHDNEPGIRRRRAGRGFCYVMPDGSRLRDEIELFRLRRIGIPPAWTEVWICTDEKGHLQATGRDAKGRKQYLYHPDFRQARDSEKFDRLAAFGRALPRIREAVLRDLALPGLPREKVLATIVHLLQTTLIRIGNTDYAKENRSYGLTTLRSAHVDVEQSVLRFDFKGKSGKVWRLKVTDRRVARIVRSLQELPGQSLFQYVEPDGARREITSNDVNEYLAGLAGKRLTAKDFRTWAGTVMAVDLLRLAPPPRSAAHGRREITAALRQIGQRLGNTVAVCRRAYVHPAVLELYLAGELKLRYGHSENNGLRPEERATLRLLRDWSAERRG
ncbi:MAG TPA: DNA topoisomerase IB [Magnetospirillaceae bacterium]|nr:DNA topoisomerase IB [Magnetospirillaceae bacterium]